MSEEISVNSIIQKLKDGQLDNPSELADDLIRLSASLMTAFAFETDSDIAYAKKWEAVKLKNPEFSDKRVDNMLKLTEEYKFLKQAKASIKTMEEVIRALKKKLTNLDTERRELQQY